MTTLVRGARQLLTLRGDAAPRRGASLSDLGLVADGAVLVRDGVIVAAGPCAGVERLPEARTAHEIDARGGVVMPGFVDSHTHLVHAAPRLGDFEMRLAGATYAEIAAAGGGILSTVRAVRSASREALLEQGRSALATMARHGATTVEAKSGYGLDRETEIRTLEIVRDLGAVPTYLGAHAVPPEAWGDSDGYIDWISREVMPEIARLRLARFADIYCDEGAFTPAQARIYLRRALDCGLLLKMHAEQFQPLGGALVAVESGAVSVDHLECAGADAIAALAGSGTIATLLPGSVFHLGLHRYAPARQLIEAGAAVALATDFNPGTSPTPSMQMVLALACSEMRMQPAEAICAATINGAHALAMADRVGSLEPDKDADLIVLEVSDYREIPYYFSVNHVRVTLQRGAVVE
jgi:imidazolonepropionase